MSVGSRFILKSVVFGIGVSTFIVGWNAISGKPVSTSDAVTQLSAYVIDGSGQSTSGQSADGSDVSTFQAAFSGMKDSVSNVGTNLRDAFASGDSSQAVVVTRGSSASRGAGGAKFVSTQR